MTDNVTKKVFGTTKDGKEVHLFSIKNSKGTEAVVTDFGAILVSLFVKNKDGELKDVVLGFDKLEDYEVNSCFFGCIVGPNANRIGKGQVPIDGKIYTMKANDGVNNLHSDYDKGFHKQLWTGEIVANGVAFTYEMPDGLVGLPGNIKVKVTYTLSEDNELKIQYEGFSNKTTVINPTNHSYFALGGHEAGEEGTNNTELMINATHFTEIDSGSIPHGNLVDVKGTPMDFTTPHKIGERVDADYEQMTMVHGYDHNYALDNYTGELQKIAEASYDGRTLEVYTTLPGVQLYTGNFISDMVGKKGVKYGYRGAFCLETQYFPNSVNVSSFASPIVKAGDKYHSTTIYKFL